jgi:O-antigen ligase
MSHWYTFSVLAMFALLLAMAYLFFAPDKSRWKWLLLPASAITALGLLLAETRAVWIATAVAALYLTWFWRRWVVFVAPVALAAGIYVAPEAIQQRFVSILRPSKLDSNEFRIVTARTGLQMIRRHPWFGLGPEMPRIDFDKYVPADIPRPLPDGSYIHLHNIYLHYAAERGIPVLLVFLWLIGKILLDFWRGLQRVPPGPDYRRFLLHAGIAVVIAILIEGFADVNLGDSEDLAMFLTVIACGYLAVDPELSAEPWKG